MKWNLKGLNRIGKVKGYAIIGADYREKVIVPCQKAMNCRNMEKVMDAFAKINVSPITISNRQEVKHLECLYTYMFGEK